MAAAFLAPAVARAGTSDIPALKDVFRDHFKIGMAVDPWVAVEPPARDILIKHASSITACEVMKPDPMGVAADIYSFGDADALVDFARSHGIAVRGHTLCWHKRASDWFFAGDPADAAYASRVQARLETYVVNVVSHFRGKVYAWDVVNEAAADSGADVGGGAYRDSRWHQVLGPDYIDIAFRAARAADPAVQLFLNDYGLEKPDKRQRFMTILDEKLKRGVPVDGVGHQLHLSIGSTTAADIEPALAAVEARGLVSHVTELDISVYGDPASCWDTPPAGCQPEILPGSAAYDAALKAQADMYRSLFDLFTAHKSVTSVTTWGVADDQTWLDAYPIMRKNYPLLFDAQGKPKPAFRAVADTTHPAE
ncbi:endo-1,4-beta-xylanase [Asticcacaulis solisilvae]|uniref:endo-1,4-beta-xylanase n=1 Tax=Asticcacaulis solisilvae TaxID=1217274 RepID=UPI003FD87FC4